MLTATQRAKLEAEGIRVLSDDDLFDVLLETAKRLAKLEAAIASALRMIDGGDAAHAGYALRAVVGNDGA